MIFEDFKFIKGHNKSLVYFAPTNRALYLSNAHSELFEKVLEDYFYSTISEVEKQKVESFISSNFCSTNSDEEYLSKVNISGLANSKHLRKLEILLCNTCNLNCKYCYANGGSYNAS